MTDNERVLNAKIDTFKHRLRVALHAPREKTMTDNERQLRTKINTLKRMRRAELEVILKISEHGRGSAQDKIDIVRRYAIKSLEANHD